jgi:hypothetical protein
MRIIGVAYQDKRSPNKNSFYSRIYSYFEEEGLNLKVGDVVLVPTGLSSALVLAQVFDVNIPESTIENFRSRVKTITSRALTDQEIKERNV